MSNRSHLGSWPPLPSNNPAIDSLLVESLFPRGIAGAELRSPGNPALLAPAERAVVERAVNKRIEEFAAGRLCARRALRRFGQDAEPLVAAPDRQPVWPAGMLGSITHTQGYCAAVVGERSRFAGLGLDTEGARAVEPELWPSICVASELDWIQRWPRAERERAATLVFCVKEAFYKAQYPISREFMVFADLEVAPAEPDANGGSLALRPLRPLRLSVLRDGRPQPRATYRFHEIFVSAAVAFDR